MWRLFERELKLAEASVIITSRSLSAEHNSATLAMIQWSWSTLSWGADDMLFAVSPVLNSLACVFALTAPYCGEDWDHCTRDLWSRWCIPGRGSTEESGPLHQAGNSSTAEMILPELLVHFSYHMRSQGVFWGAILLEKQSSERNTKGLVMCVACLAPDICFMLHSSHFVFFCHCQWTEAWNNG